MAPRYQITFIGREPEVSPDDFAGALSKLGVPEWQVEGLVEDYAHYSRGEAAEIHSIVREITGTDAQDVRVFARDYASV
jgi:uncharacterized protein YbjT (DUF2867 family)